MAIDTSLKCDMKLIAGIGEIVKCLIFDPFCGASASMILGALLGCGADEWRVRSVVEGLCDAPLDVQESRSGRMAVKLAELNVKAARKSHPDMEREAVLEKMNVMHENQPVRVDSMEIAKKIFDAHEALYGKGHKMDIFTIAMIAGICTAYDSLKRPYVQSTPAAMGGGSITTNAGTEPVPRPVVLKALEGSIVITQGGPLDGELLTLTAAAVLAYYVQESGRYYPENRTLAVGYGGESGETQALRATLCEIDDALIGDRMELLETNVDDVTGEVLGSLIESLMDMGAMDVSIIPATMKKGRTGHIIRAIVKADDSPHIARRIVLETGSLGVRVLPVKHRFIAQRKIANIDTPIEGNHYDMRFKVATDTNGKILDVSVEYEDAKMVSRELALPLKTVMRIAESEAWKHYEK